MEKKPSRARELEERFEAQGIHVDDLQPPEEDKAALSVLLRHGQEFRECMNDLCPSPDRDRASKGWSRYVSPDMEMAFWAGRAYERLMQTEGT